MTLTTPLAIAALTPGCTVGWLLLQCRRYRRDHATASAWTPADTVDATMPNGGDD